MLSPRLSSSRSTSPPAGPSEFEHRGQSTQPVPPHSLHDWNSVSPSGPAVFFSPAPSHSSQATCRCPLHFGQNCIGNYVDGSKPFESALVLCKRTTPLSGSAGSLSRDDRAEQPIRRAVSLWATPTVQCSDEALSAESSSLGPSYDRGISSEKGKAGTTPCFVALPPTDSAN